MPLAETKKAREARIGGFSDPSKMPSLSWGTPADYCILGTKLRRIKGSACSKCYATKGLYRFPCVKHANERRFRILMAALETLEGAERFVADFVEALGRNREKDSGYFRWDDTGDLQSVAHLRAIAEIARRMPERKFWLPTRELGIVRAYRKTDTIPTNLTIRISAPMIDRLPVTDGLPGAAIHREAPQPSATECGAYRNGGACGPCRKCWDPDVALITYPLH